jgi:hypothetical protein
LSLWLIARWDQPLYHYFDPHAIGFFRLCLFYRRWYLYPFRLTLSSVLGLWSDKPALVTCLGSFRGWWYWSLNTVPYGYVSNSVTTLPWLLSKIYSPNCYLIHCFSEVGEKQVSTLELNVDTYRQIILTFFNPKTLNPRQLVRKGEVRLRLILLSDFIR